MACPVAASTARASGAARVLIVGDSMIAGGFGVFLERALVEDGYGVKRRGKSSSGLARPDFFDWQQEARHLAKAAPFDAAVLMFGGNDVQGLRMPDRSWIRWHDEGWSGEYAARVARLCDTLSPRGQQIFWVGMPVVRPEKMRSRVERVNTIFRAEMAIRRGAHFVDTWHLFADEQGGYSDRLTVETLRDDGSVRRQRVRMRAGDGVHLTTAGAHYLKDHVRGVILEALPAVAPASQG